VTDFVNLKIKPAQSFKCARRDRVCICVFIEDEYSFVYEYLCLYCVLKITPDKPNTDLRSAECV
jgi:hypothetical protein